MAVVEFQMRAEAPPERVFDLSRSIDVHLESTGSSGERVVGGVRTGLLELGQEVEWEATHFGVKQRLRSRITQLERPDHFRDSMVAGAFRRFDHDHFFEPSGAGTLIRERFDFSAPFGPLGRLAEIIFLTAYMRRFLMARTQVIVAIAESDRWRRYIEPDSSSAAP